MARNVKKTETGCIFGNLYGIVIINGNGMFIFQNINGGFYERNTCFFDFFDLVLRVWL